MEYSLAMYGERERIKLIRDELYEQVWQKPMRRLASEYHVSDVALAKVCRKLSVPVPPRGYWAKLAHGKSPRKAALPKLKVGQPDSLWMLDKSEEKKEPGRWPELTERLDYVRGLQIEASESITEMHPVVQRTIEELCRSRTSVEGLKTPRTKRALDATVSEQSLERASRILNALLVAFEECGFKVATGEHTVVEMPGASLAIRLEELLQAEERNPTPKEKREEQYHIKHSRLRWRDGEVVKDAIEPAKYYRYVASGRLALRIFSEERLGLRKTWSDGDKKLENKLNAFVIGIIRYAIGVCEAREECEQTEREREAKWAHEAKEAARKSEDRRKREKFRELADKFRDWQRMREFADAVMIELREKGTEATVELEEWQDWAETNLELINPLRLFCKEFGFGLSD